MIEALPVDNLNGSISTEDVTRQPHLAATASADFLQPLVIWDRWQGRNDGILKCWTGGRSTRAARRFNEAIRRVRVHLAPTLSESNGKETAKTCATHLHTPFQARTSCAAPGPILMLGAERPLPPTCLPKIDYPFARPPF